MRKIKTLEKQVRKLQEELKIMQRIDPNEKHPKGLSIRVPYWMDEAIEACVKPGLSKSEVLRSFIARALLQIDEDDNPGFLNHRHREGLERFLYHRNNKRLKKFNDHIEATPEEPDYDYEQLRRHESGSGLNK